MRRAGQIVYVAIAALIFLGLFYLDVDTETPQTAFRSTDHTRHAFRPRVGLPPPDQTPGRSLPDHSVGVIVAFEK
jgi:hypothetical protein